MHLHEQYAVPASTEVKIKLSLLGTAIVDALGAPPEFQPRYSFPWVTEMQPNNNFDETLPPGVWTDDTSMTLCLAESLSTCKEAGGFSEVHQLETYSKWRLAGHLSAVGRCFDIGDTIAKALTTYSASGRQTALREIRFKFSAENYAGNGSLMRVLPIGLLYWRNLEQAKQLARLSSATTHPTKLCLEACEVWTGAISLIMQHTTIKGGAPLSKFALFEYFVTYPYQHKKLKEAMALPSDIPDVPSDLAEKEEWYRAHHPLLRLIEETKNQAPIGKRPYALPSEKQLPSSGYVLHTFIAALYGFFATNTFEEGAIMVVNLGSDADTVGAVYAGLAACWYTGGEDNEAGNQLFWSDRVRRWRNGIVKRELVERVAEGLISRDNAPL